MPKQLPNFIYGAIYRSKSGRADSSASAARFNCYMPASEDIPKEAFVADCWVCDAHGRIDPGLNVSPIPVRKEDLGRIINTISNGQRL
jgi:hypothetical protein